MKELPDELKPTKTKRKKEEEIEEEELPVPFLVYFKGFFLLLIILAGMFFLHKASQQPKNTENSDSLLSLPTSDSFKKSISKEKIADTIEEELETNELYHTAIKKIENQRDYVLGEATKAATQVADQSKDYFYDQIYDATLGKVMEQLINQMPEDAQDRLIEKVEKENE